MRPLSLFVVGVRILAGLVRRVMNVLCLWAASCAGVNACVVRMFVCSLVCACLRVCLFVCVLVCLCGCLIVCA